MINARSFYKFSEIGKSLNAIIQTLLHTTLVELNYNQKVLGMSNETKTHSAAQFGDSAIQNE